LTSCIPFQVAIRHPSLDKFVSTHRHNTTKMCKAIDFPLDAASTAAHPSLKNNNNKKKRVRFRASSIIEFEKVTHPPEKEAVWYNRKEFEDIRAEIGRVVQARADGFQDEDFNCFRGLEFLKLGNSPSRKERRLLYSRHVLVYQQVTERKLTTEEPADLIGAFCTKMSQHAKESALSFASGDESEARRVYHECHLLYRVNGNDECMFGDADRRSSLCRKHSSEVRVFGIGNPLPEVFSYNGLCRVIQNVRDNTNLFATRVN